MNYPNIQSLPRGGRLNSTISNIFVCPNGKRARLKNISIVNFDGVSRKVDLYIAAKDELQRITPKELWIPDGGMARDGDEHILNAGNILMGNADAADRVSFLIDGELIEDVSSI
jgi:hypothetical protein